MFETLLPKGQKKKPAEPQEKGARADKNAKLRKIVGARFIEAREVNGWSQSDAATLLGYDNSTQLSLIERAVRLPPIELVKRASTVYGVSSDYFLGLSDEPERDPKQAEKRAALRQVHEMLVANSEAMVDAVFDHIASGAPTVQTTRTLLENVKKARDAFARFHEINAKRFDTLRGGSALLFSMRELDSAISRSELLLAKHDHFVTKAQAEARAKRERESRERADRRAKERLRDCLGASSLPDQFQLMVGDIQVGARPQ